MWSGSPQPEGEGNRAFLTLIVLKVHFERSLHNGTVPSDRNSANVSPLLKTRDKSSAANYRPISLICILCKAMEHIIASNIVKHLDTNNIMYDLQHGFRERRSCETHLASLVEDLAIKSRQGKQTDLILLDFSKAFDGLEAVFVWYKRSYLALDTDISEQSSAESCCWWWPFGICPCDIRSSSGLSLGADSLSRLHQRPPPGHSLTGASYRRRHCHSSHPWL